MKKITIILFMALYGYSEAQEARPGKTEKGCDCPSISWNYKLLSTTRYVMVNFSEMYMWDVTEQCVGESITSNQQTLTANGTCGTHPMHPNVRHRNYNYCIDPKITLPGGISDVCMLLGSINVTTNVLKDQEYYIKDIRYKEVCLQFTAEYSMINFANGKVTNCSATSEVYSYKLKKETITNTCLIDNNMLDGGWSLEGSANCSGFVVFGGGEERKASIAKDESIESIALQNNIMIYPNPASEELNLSILSDKIEGSKINIYSLDGKLVLSKIVSNSMTHKLDISNLDGGLYTINIIVKEKTIQRLRFIKME